MPELSRFFGIVIRMFFEVGGLVYVGMAVRTMWISSPATIARHAARNDDTRRVITGLVLLAVGSSLSSILGLLGLAKTATGGTRSVYLALAAATIVLAWTVMQVVFTLHYAHEHYRPVAPDDRTGGDGPDRKLQGGLVFPGEPSPDYWDFLYFATSIGATSQTSDVTIQSRPIRRLATVHAVLSFFFNATILALLINLAAGLI